MPTYEYSCNSCGEHLEVVQSFRDDPLTECPACSGPLRKVFGSIGVVFKGSGFYKTDSRSAASSAKKAESAEAKSKETAKDTSSAAKSADGSSAKSADGSSAKSADGSSGSSDGSKGSGSSSSKSPSKPAPKTAAAS